MVKVLVVDDLPVGDHHPARLPGHHGHVVEAADRAEALLVAEAESPGLVITHLLMPEMDGYEFVRELRAVPALASTRVISSTASGVVRILAEPADPHVGAVLAGVPPLSDRLAGEVRGLEAAESALKESEARFRSLAESSPIGIVSLDSAGCVSYSNPRLRQICGLTDMDGMAPPFWAELLHPDDRDRALVGISDALAAAGRYRDQVRIVRPDSGVRWVVVQLTPLGGDDEHFRHVGTVEDVTEMVEALRQRQELEARLRTAERLDSVGQLAAGIAHDFNNVLGAILTYAQCISSDIEDLAGSGPEWPRLAQMGADAAAISTAAESAAELTRQLLLFSRSEMIHTEVIDANEVVGHAEKLLTRTIGENVRLESRLDPGLWPIRGDHGRLEQVLVNLVVNARDAITSTGAITITTENVVFDEVAAALHPGALPGRYSRITVIDNGEGMAPETAARAFEPFFTTKPEGMGTGLGLATVHGIVNQLGGYVGIYSEPGTGTAVRVYLPAVDRARKRVFPTAEPPPTGQAEVILVVDDDEAMRVVATRILTENGYSVVSTESAAAAVVMLEDSSKRFDLLLTDVVMPEMSGREVAGRAEESRPGVPVLFMSGYPNGVPGGQAENPGVAEVLEKPFTHTSLLRGVANALGRPSDPG